MGKKDDKVGNKKGSAQCEKIDKRGKEGEKERSKIRQKRLQLASCECTKKKVAWLEFLGSIPPHFERLPRRH